MQAVTQAVTEPAPGPLAVIVLAAGSGTRMRSRTPKVLHPLCGRSMLGHVLAAAAEASPKHLVVVVGHGREQVTAAVRSQVPDAVIAVQEEQRGTGHAVSVGVAALVDAVGSVGSVGSADAAGAAELRGTVLVTTGDTPLLEGGTLRRLVQEQGTSSGPLDGTGRTAATLLTAEVPDPFGYGRVLRDDAGGVTAVVEEKDADPVQAAVREINSGIYAFDAGFLRSALDRVGSDNAKGEYYLTDTVGIATEDGLSVRTLRTDDVAQTAGANDRVQLAALAAELNRRILERHMRAGVTVVDPGSTWVDVTVTLEPDVTLLPGTQLLGATAVAQDAVVGPDCTLKDVEVGPGAKLVRTHGELAVVGAGAAVGPFAYLRPGTELGVGGKIGTYVETKNARIGPGAKIPHLSYVGDAEIGEGTNIGAGTIFANYDGVTKHRTTVGQQAKTGANNTFVAPVSIGDGAVTGGGTVVRRDVPAGALAVSAAPQRNLEGWVLRNRAGTATAAAAEAASAPHDRSGDQQPDPSSDQPGDQSGYQPGNEVSHPGGGGASDGIQRRE